MDMCETHHGNGDGTFPWSTTVDLGGVSGWSIVAGYWNADSYLDLATANRYDNNISVLLGDGLVGFSLATPATYSLGMAARSIKTRDLNADSKSDLVVAGGASTDSRIWVLLGNGNGTFQTPTNYPVTGTGGSL